MKTTTLILSLAILLAFASDANAQTNFPDETVSQKWEYVTWYFWGGHCEKRIIKNGNVAEVCEAQYIEIFDCNENEENCYLLGYYRILGDSILTRSVGYWNGQSHIDSADCSKPFGLTYDFGSETGDSLKCAVNSYDPFLKEFWIDDVQEIEYEGIERTTQLVKYRAFPNSPNVIYKMDWVEGIGSNVHPFYSLSCIGDHCEQEQQVTAVYRNDDLIYQDTVLHFGFSCTSWVSSTDDIKSKKEDIAILPNPAFDFIEIQSNAIKNKSIDLTIIDLNGKVVTMKSNVSSGDYVDIRDLIPGTYFLSLKSAKISQVKKFIKI